MPRSPFSTPCTGELRRLQKHGWLGAVQLAVFALSMLLPMPSAHSDYWADLDNDGVPEQYGDDDGSDTDSDGLKDGFEIYVSGTDPLNWDSNNNGYSDGDEHHQNYGVNYWYSTAMNVQGTVTFADFDGDGTPNWQDSLPVDGLNGMGDRDTDGIWDMFDSYPDDYYNGDPWMGQPHFNYNGTEYYGSWMDSDNDSIPDAADSYPYDSTNGTSWTNSWGGDYMINGSYTYLSGSYSSWDTLNDSDSDGIYDMFDPYPYDSTNNTSLWSGGTFMINGYSQWLSGSGYYATSSGDTDSDGIYDMYDPYPNDPTNNTSWWGGGGYMINNSSTWFSDQYFAGSWIDSDNDSIPDAFDPYAYDPNNGTSTWMDTTHSWSGNYMVNGTNTYLSGSYSSSEILYDMDGDGIYDMFDPYQGDSTNNTSYWNGQYYVDGMSTTLGGAYSSSVSLTDTDSDGIFDMFDPYQSDSTNNTSYIGGQYYAGRAFDGVHPETTSAWLTDWFAHPENRIEAPLYLSLTNLADSDGDTIPDEIEDFFGLNKQDVTDAFMVQEGSAYTNLERYLGWQDLRDPFDPWQYGQADSIPNMWKVHYGFDLQDPGLFLQDTDTDGLDNLSEYGHGTNPLLADTDEDGESDGAEVAQGSSPTDAASNAASVAAAAEAAEAEAAAQAAAEAAAAAAQAAAQAAAAALVAEPPRFAVFTSHRTRSLSFTGSDGPDIPMSEVIWQESNEIVGWEKYNSGQPTAPVQQPHDGFNADADYSGDKFEIGDPRDLILIEPQYNTESATEGEPGAWPIYKSYGWGQDAPHPIGPSIGRETTGKYEASNAYRKPYKLEISQEVSTRTFNPATGLVVLNQVAFSHTDSNQGWQGNGYLGIASYSVNSFWYNGTREFENYYTDPETGDQGTSQETFHLTGAWMNEVHIRLQSNVDVESGKTVEATYIVAKHTTELGEFGAPSTPPVLEVLGTIALVITAGKISTDHRVTGSIPSYIMVSDGVIIARPPVPVENKMISVTFATIELSSQKAAIEPERKVTNPTYFSELGKTNWGDIYEDANVPACTIYYKDVIDGSFAVQPFDVNLKFGPGMTGASWSKLEGPDSGSITGAGPDVIYKNPNKGGVYNLNATFASRTTLTHLVLPLAGAEVKDLVASDLIKADAFATKVNATYNVLERNWPFNGLRWFSNGGAGDYLGRPDNANSRTIWKHNQVSSVGMATVATWFGYPTRIAKMSNYLIAYAARKIGVTSVSAWVAQGIGSRNDASAEKSWDAGWAVAGGSDYTTTTSAMTKDIWDKADDKNRKLWPNPQPLDNYVSRAAWVDPDREFSSPGFLEMTSP